MIHAVYGWAYIESAYWGKRGAWVAVSSSYTEDLSEALDDTPAASALVQLDEKADGGFGIQVRLRRDSRIQMHPNGRVIGLKGSADEGLMQVLLRAWKRMLKARPHRRRTILQQELLAYEAFLGARAERLKGCIPWSISTPGPSAPKPKSSSRPHRRV